VALFRATPQAVATAPGLAERRLVARDRAPMINELVLDLLDETARRIAEAGPRSVDDVRSPPALVAFSARCAAQSTQLKRFLYRQRCTGTTA
jgi:dGTPase